MDPGKTKIPNLSKKASSTLSNKSIKVEYVDENGKRDEKKDDKKQ